MVNSPKAYPPPPKPDTHTHNHDHAAGAPPPPPPPKPDPAPKSAAGNAWLGNTQADHIIQNKAEEFLKNAKSKCHADAAADDARSLLSLNHDTLAKTPNGKDDEVGHELIHATAALASDWLQDHGTKEQKAEAVEAYGLTHSGTFKATGNADKDLKTIESSNTASFEKHAKADPKAAKAVGEALFCDDPKVPAKEGHKAPPKEDPKAPPK
ncbi:MAG TPA: hypothetical protein VFH51_07840 [Myxococcota bacterium]|nr:hypothetical protein [Myxococcota bacterium]